MTEASEQPGRIQFELPAWLAKLARQPEPLADVNARMALVLEAARRNIRERSGGPFAAGVFERDSGRLVSLGVNLVTTQGLSMLHAEMVALSLAQRRLDSFDLAAPGLPPLQLVSSTEPCAMCAGAIPWSGVRGLVCGATGADAEAIGFDEGEKPENWVSAMQARGIEVTTGVLRMEAQAILRTYSETQGQIYNPRH